MALENLALLLVENNRITEARGVVREGRTASSSGHYSQTVLAHLQILCDQNYARRHPLVRESFPGNGRFPVVHSTQMMAYYIHAVLAEAVFSNPAVSSKPRPSYRASSALLPPLTARTYFDSTPQAMADAACASMIAWRPFWP